MRPKPKKPLHKQRPTHLVGGKRGTEEPSLVTQIKFHFLSKAVWSPLNKLLCKRSWIEKWDSYIQIHGPERCSSVEAMLAHMHIDVKGSA